jgi:WD40 repeat protein
MTVRKDLWSFGLMLGCALILAVFAPAPSEADEGKAKIAVIAETGHAAGINSVAVSPDGVFALTGSEDHTVRLWNIETGTLIRTFQAHGVRIKSVAVSPDGSLVLAGGGDLGTSATKGLVELWDTRTGAMVRNFDGLSGPVESVAFSPDGLSIISGGFDLKLWNASTGELLRSFDTGSDSVHSVAFSPEGGEVLIALSKGIKLLNVATGALVHSFDGEDEPARYCAPSRGTMKMSPRLRSRQTGRMRFQEAGITPRSCGMSPPEKPFVPSQGTRDLSRRWRFCPMAPTC